MAGTEDMLTALTDLTKEFDLIYAGAKRKAGVVDFNDIEHFALDIKHSGALQNAAWQNLTV